MLAMAHHSLLARRCASAAVAGQARRGLRQLSVAAAASSSVPVPLGPKHAEALELLTEHARVGTSLVSGMPRISTHFPAGVAQQGGAPTARAHVRARTLAPACDTREQDTAPGRRPRRRCVAPKPRLLPRAGRELAVC